MKSNISTISVEVPSEEKLLEILFKTLNIPESDQEVLRSSKNKDKELSVKALEYLFTKHHDITDTLESSELILRPASWKSIALAIYSGEDLQVSASGKGMVQKGKTMGDGPFSGFIPGSRQQGVGKAGAANSAGEIKLYNEFINHRYHDSVENFKRAQEIIKKAKDEIRTLSPEEVKNCNELLDHYNFDVLAKTKDGDQVFVFLDRDGKAQKDKGGKVLYGIQKQGEYFRVKDDHSISEVQIPLSLKFRPQKLKLSATKDMKVGDDSVIKSISNTVITFDPRGNIKHRPNEVVNLSSGDIDLLGEIKKTGVQRSQKTLDSRKFYDFQGLIERDQEDYAQKLGQMYLLKQYRDPEKKEIIVKLLEENYDKHSLQDLNPKDQELIKKNFNITDEESGIKVLGFFRELVQIEKEHKLKEKLGVGTEEQLSDAGMIQKLISKTSKTGMFRHGPESANYFLPQKHDPYLYHVRLDGGRIKIDTIEGGERGYVDYINKLQKQNPEIDYSAAVNPGWGWQKNEKGEYEVSPNKIELAGVGINPKGTSEIDKDNQNLVRLAYNYNKSIFNGQDDGLQKTKFTLFTLAEERYRKKYGKPSPIFDEALKNNDIEKKIQKNLALTSEIENISKGLSGFVLSTSKSLPDMSKTTNISSSKKRSNGIIG